jgi:hypothetical protein
MADPDQVEQGERWTIWRCTICGWNRANREDAARYLIRAETAEAEVERLREVLNRIIINLPDKYLDAEAIARSALTPQQDTDEG